LNPADGPIRFWTKAVAWEPACHKLALFYRDRLRAAWHPPRPGRYDISTGEDFEILMGLQAGYEYHGREDELKAILATRKSAHATINNAVLADWKTGSFVYRPINDFQRAVYMLFREGWRAKVCARSRCKRRFIADKPLQRYCSTKCSGEAKRERNLEWWNKHGKRSRTMHRASSRHKGKG
jgi:hypothetical protein